MFRIGYGTDIHRLVEGRPLILGGVLVDSDLGAEGHSDADALMHAAADAVLGALALGDIGTHFPNDDERWRDAASEKFVRHAAGLVAEHGYSIVNMDAVVDLELPKLRPHIDQMRANLAAALGSSVDSVSVKAKTGEAVDAVGGRRAVRAQAVVLVARTDRR